MFVRSAPCAALLLLALAPAGASPAPAGEAARVFEAALEAQGAIAFDRIRDVEVRFRGQIRDSKSGVHSARRTYWYRAADRAFRIRTSAGAGRFRAERGVLPGPQGGIYWQRTGRGRVLVLSRRNRDDRRTIRAIRKERDEFEGLLRMVLLARLADGRTRFTLARPEPVRLERDLPYEAAGILGRDRSRRRYRVVDLEREGEPRLRLFVDTRDHTVRKAVQFDPDDPARVLGVYYLGPYPPADAPKPRIPYYFSAHSAVPVSEESREKTCRAHGEVRVVLNAGLADEVFAPPTRAVPGGR